MRRPPSASHAVSFSRSTSSSSTSATPSTDHGQSLRPWRFFAEPVRHRRASRSASRCGRSLDLQRDALRAAGVDDAVNLYHDFASGLRDDRPGLDSCLRVLRKGDVLMVWKLDRLGRNLAHLVVVSDLRPLAGEHPQAHAAGRQILHGV